MTHPQPDVTCACATEEPPTEARFDGWAWMVVSFIALLLLALVGAREPVGCEEDE